MMDVTLNRTIDDVIILGSGKSISNLSKAEIDYINKCKTVIALNKFMIGYKLSGILPTHIFFLDCHENSLKILDYVFRICIRDNLEGLTFVVASQISDLTYRNRREWFQRWVQKNLDNTRRLLERQKVSTLLSDLLGKFTLYRIPKKSDFVFTSHNHWLVGGEWATDISMPLYHYRGSLTSVLNYAALISPGNDVYLVGNDFNSSEYFFQKEMAKLPFQWEDATAQIVREKNRHFSVIEYEGKTIFDRLPFIVQKLKDNGNNIFCVNPDSLMVTIGKIPYKELPCG